MNDDYPGYVYAALGTRIEALGEWLVQQPGGGLLMEGWGLAYSVVSDAHPAIQDTLGATPGNLYLVQRLIEGAAHVRPELFEVHDKPEGE